jgi:hypothetical protein
MLRQKRLLMAMCMDQVDTIISRLLNESKKRPVALFLCQKSGQGIISLSGGGLRGLRIGQV